MMFRSNRKQRLRALLFCVRTHFSEDVLARD
jgi:hypothetical protein